MQQTGNFFHGRAPLIAAALAGAVLLGLPPQACAQAPGVGASPSASASASAGSIDSARRQYGLDLAVCNSGSLPAPERERCIRDAGLRYDRVRGVPVAPTAVQSNDGRATVLAPSPGSTTLRGSTTTTTSDGRATVVVPEAKPTP